MNQVSFQQEQSPLQKRKRSLLFTGALFFLFVSLTVLQVYLQQQQGKPSSIPSNILILVVVNLNVIVLMVLVVMVGRNLAKIYFEHKRGRLGSKFKVKLITAFISLTIIPTFLLFLVASGFITSNIEGWFSKQKEEALKDALSVAQSYYQGMDRRAGTLSQEIVNVARKQGLLGSSNYWKLVWLLKEKAREHRLKAVEIFDVKGHILASSKGKGRRGKEYLVQEGDTKLLQSLKDKKPISWDHGRYHIVVVPFSEGGTAFSYKIPSRLSKSLVAITQYYEGYRQVKELKNPIKISYILLFLMATLLIVFSSIWFGLHLAKGITVPIEALALGTREVARGNLDTQIQVQADDEIGILVDSFNLMIRDLKGSREELEERRRYIETILENIATGVISLDKEGRVISINRAARGLLRLENEPCLEVSYRQIFHEEHLGVLKETVKVMLRRGREGSRREVRLVREEGVIHLLVGASPLLDQEGRYSGMVVVMEDMTELAKAQRAAAWEEVARRVAHEIKNPLTPISLSAQRLKRRFGGHMKGEEGEVFYRCIETIIKEVEELKRMVNEFYKFARLPKISPRPTLLQEILRDLVALYSASHKGITIQVDVPQDLPPLLLDREQMNRVFINLMENAIEAMHGQGVITIKVDWREEEQTVVVEVADEGVGIRPEDRERLFIPYFSTKERGTGLGLAIVSRIISDHGGYIMVRENKPRGAVFVIELPGKAA